MVWNTSFFSILRHFHILFHVCWFIKHNPYNPFSILITHLTYYVKLLYSESAIQWSTEVSFWPEQWKLYSTSIFIGYKIHVNYCLFALQKKTWKFFYVLWSLWFSSHHDSSLFIGVRDMLIRHFTVLYTPINLN